MQEEKEIDEMLILVEMVNCSLGIAIQSLVSIAIQYWKCTLPTAVFLCWPLSLFNNFDMLAEIRFSTMKQYKESYTLSELSIDLIFCGGYFLEFSSFSLLNCDILIMNIESST